jgi:hypothetical protein
MSKLLELPRLMLLLEDSGCEPEDEDRFLNSKPPLTSPQAIKSKAKSISKQTVLIESKIEIFGNYIQSYRLSAYG